MDIQEIIKNRYKELPKDIQEAIKSADLATKFKTIADKHGLHIDQNGALQTETILVMIGLEPTKDYISNIQTNVDVTREVAQSIADDVNTDILGPIRSSLVAMQEEESTTSTPEQTKAPIANEPPPIKLVNLIIPTPPDHSAIEQAAQMKIEEIHPVQTNQYSNPIDKDAILKKIEADHVPMIDHLLTEHVNTKEEVEVKSAPAPQPTEKKESYSSDPYREQV